MVQSFMAKNRSGNYKGGFTILFLYNTCPLLGKLKNSAQYATLLRALLADYRSIRPLDPDHEALIDVLIAARHATTILWQWACSGTGACRPKIWLGTLVIAHGRWSGPWGEVYSLPQARLALSGPGQSPSICS